MMANKYARFESIFQTKSNVILPVLACYTVAQYKKNITYLAAFHQQKLIHGVWLVSSNCHPDIIEEVVQLVKATLPTFWVGVNLLGVNLFSVLDFLTKHRIDGLWLDKSYVTEDKEQTVPNIIVDQLARRNWNGLYFGGVLFKYIPEKGDPVKVLRNAIPYMDVLCTTGIATGVSITREKLNMVTSVLTGDIPIAIASGISSKSVNILKDKIQVYMFRDACANKDEDIVPELFEQVIQAIRS